MNLWLLYDYLHFIVIKILYSVQGVSVPECRDQKTVELETCLSIFSIQTYSLLTQAPWMCQGDTKK